MKAERDKQRSPRQWMLLVLLAVFVLGSLAAGWWLLNRRLEKARVEYTDPYVTIREPLQGQRYKPNAPLIIRGTALGPYPILRVELYADGVLSAVDESATELGSQPLFASFSFRLPAGVHMLYLRAVDTEGRVGQSLPVSIEAVDLPGGLTEVFIPYGPDSSPGGAAEKYNLPIDLVVSANPGLENPDLPPPDLLVIPGEAVQEDDGLEEEDSLPSLAGAGYPSWDDMGSGTPLTAAGVIFPGNNVANLPWAAFLPPSAPSAPSDVRAQVQDCLVNIAWTSPNDAKEFRIWIDKQNGNRLLVAKLNPTKPASERYQYQFEPRIGGTISLFVEAVNALGSQSSRPVTLSLQNSCHQDNTDRISFKALDVKASPELNQVYFYISFGGQPEQRFPLDDSQFYRLLSDRGQVQPRSSADETLVLPPLGDGALDLSGECWGWSGGEPVRLERFIESIPQSEMHGQEIILGGPSCQITILLQPVEDSQSLTAYDGDMGGLPAPYNLKYQKQKQLEPYLSPFVPAYEWLYRYTRFVTWSWDGNPADITGFTIYINGKPAAQVQGGNVRKTLIVVPDQCGPPITWSVVANGKSGDSPMSQVDSIWQGPCTYYARVEFMNLHLSRTCDNRPSCGTSWFYCDTLEAYFELSVNQITRKFYSSNFVLKMDCHDSFMFKDIVTQPSGHVFLVPMFTETTFVQSQSPFEVVVETEFWDQDTWSGDDSFGHHKKKHGFTNWPIAINWFNQSCGESHWDYPFFVCDPDMVMTTISKNKDSDANTSITYSLSLYPNYKLDSPP